MRILPPIDTRVNPAEPSRAHRIDRPAILGGVGYYLNSLAAADLKVQVEASSRLHILGLVVLARPDAIGEVAR